MARALRIMRAHTLRVKGITMARPTEAARTTRNLIIGAACVAGVRPSHLAALFGITRILVKRIAAEYLADPAEIEAQYRAENPDHGGDAGLPLPTDPERIARVAADFAKRREARLLAEQKRGERRRRRKALADQWAKEDGY